PDAAGMRFSASQIRSRADRLAVVASRLDTLLASMTFAGPAADQFHAGAMDKLQQLKQASNVLTQAADVLVRGAASVEADPLGFYGSGGRV
ncbi:MAG TPA: hypothetical protein VIH06_12305, partial [Ilumatobacteraceae bacterium]